MSKIKIVIDTESLIDVNQAIKMLQALEGTATAVSTDKKEEAKPEENKADEPEKPKRQRKFDGKKDESKQEVSEAEETEAEETEAEETEAEETKKPEAKKEKSDSKVTIDELRTLLAEKVTDHRQLIKNKLTELGASSVSTLDPEHFKAFHDFLDYL